MKSGRIYIHIPFCQKACTYCNFHFTTRTDLINAYVQALVSEIHQRSHTLAAEIQSVYFGGGTPSLLNPNQLNVILKTLTGYAKLTPDTEITLEINPEDTNQERVVQWLDLGINRFSVGVQSLDEAELAWMGRIHTINKTYKLLELFYKNNVKNYNLDLIFGSGKSSLEQWNIQLKNWTAFNAPHISAYQLTVEPKTILANRVKNRLYHPPNEEILAEFFIQTHDTLTQAGYHHYEISNYAKPGFEASHNAAYWRSEAYIGLGPSAHSFNGISSRRVNLPGVASYIKNAAMQVYQHENEVLNENELFNEKILTRLRTREGLQWEEIRINFGTQALNNLKEALVKWKSYLEYDEPGVRLNLRGMLISDAICRDLFRT